MKFRDALFTLLVFAAPAAFGQNSASLGGTIQDSTGAVVPKATVRLTSHEQGTVRSAESNQTGLYSFTFLPRGVYDVEVTPTGFRTLSDKNITLATAESVRRDYTVEVGNVSDNVTISAEAQSVNTDNAEMGASAGQQQGDRNATQRPNLLLAGQPDAGRHRAAQQSGFPRRLQRGRRQSGRQ